MSKKIAIERIVLRIGNKEISLTPEEARELRQQLHDLLGSMVTVTGPWWVYPSTTTITTSTPGDTVYIGASSVSN